jgi:zinc protease
MSVRIGARAVRPALREPATPRLPPVQHHRLANGLEIIIVEQRDLPVVNVQLVTRVGGTHDGAALAGRAYLMARVLDHGTATRSATGIADEAEQLGASLHTRGSWDFCTVALHVLTPRLRPALELLADVALAPVFPPAELERKRDERLAAILHESSEPRALVSNAFLDVVYGAEHRFGTPIGGTAATVGRIGRDDVTDLYAAGFEPTSAFLVIVGDVTAREILPVVERLFGGWARAAAAAAPAGGAPPGIHSVVPATAASPSVGGAATAEGLTHPRRAIHVVHRPEATQSEVRVGLAGPARAMTDYFPLLVANTVLGGAFTSRLNMLLREEKAYTYGAGSSVALRAAGGPFAASTAVHTAATADTVDTIVREIDRLAAEPVPADELARAQSYIVLGMPRTFETTADIAEHVSQVALYGLGDDWFDRYAERVNAVTAADITAAAARWLPADALSVVIAGDADMIRTDLESLDLGAVHVRSGA